MELLAAEPALDLNDPRWPVLTYAEPLPPARLLGGGRRRPSVSNSLLSAGVVVRGASVLNCDRLAIHELLFSPTLERIFVLGLYRRRDASP